MPRSMVTSYLVNAVTAFATIIILLFFMGDPDKALTSPSGWPIIEILYQAAGTLSGMNTLMSMFLILGIIAYFNGIACKQAPSSLPLTVPFTDFCEAVSRLTWAFGTAQPFFLQPHARRWLMMLKARDDGLPFSDYFKVVSRSSS